MPSSANDLGKDQCAGQERARGQPLMGCRGIGVEVMTTIEAGVRYGGVAGKKGLAAPSGVGTGSRGRKTAVPQ